MNQVPFTEKVFDVTSKYTKIKKSDYKSSGRYKIIDQGKEEVAGYTDNIELITEPQKPVIIFGDHTRCFKYIDYPIALGADGAKVLKTADDTLPKYIYYYLKGYNLYNAGYSRHFKYLKEIKIPLPPLEDQKRIASILTRLEKQITLRKESIQLLDKLLKSTFLEMFGDPVRNEKGWKKSRLNHFFKIKHGYAFKSQYFKNEGQFVLLTPGNFQEGGGYRYRGERQKYFVGEVPQDYILNENDLLIAMTEQAPGLLGSPIFVPSGGIYLHNQRLGLVELKNEINKIFLFHFFNQKSIRQIIHSKATGMKVRHTSPTKIEDILAGIPPITMQDKFSDIAKKIESIKSGYQLSLSELENLYGSLSQKAFKGELDLSKIPLPKEDEPGDKEKKTIKIQAFQGKDEPEGKTENKTLKTLATLALATGGVYLAKKLYESITKKDKQIEDFILTESYLNEIITKKVMLTMFDDVESRFSFIDLWEKTRESIISEMPADVSLASGWEDVLYLHIKSELFNLLEEKKLSQIFDEEKKEMLLSVNR